MKTYNDIPSVHLVQVKYMGPTNCRGARVKLTSPRFDQSIMFSYDYSKRDVLEMAYDWLVAHNYDIVGLAETKTGYAVLTNTFKGLKD